MIVHASKWNNYFSVWFFQINNFINYINYVNSETSSRWYLRLVKFMPICVSETSQLVLYTTTYCRSRNPQTQCPNTLPSFPKQGKFSIASLLTCSIRKMVLSALIFLHFSRFFNMISSRRRFLPGLLQIFKLFISIFVVCHTCASN